MRFDAKTKSIGPSKAERIRTLMAAGRYTTSEIATKVGCSDAYVRVCGRQRKLGKTDERAGRYRKRLRAQAMLADRMEARAAGIAARRKARRAGADSQRAQYRYGSAYNQALYKAVVARLKAGGAVRPLRTDARALQDAGR